MTLEEILDKHLQHRNPADLQRREQLIAALLKWKADEGKL